MAEFNFTIPNNLDTNGTPKKDVRIQDICPVDDQLVACSLPYHLQHYPPFTQKSVKAIVEILDELLPVAQHLINVESKLRSLAELVEAEEECQPSLKGPASAFLDDDRFQRMATLRGALTDKTPPFTEWADSAGLDVTFAISYVEVMLKYFESAYEAVDSSSLMIMLHSAGQQELRGMPLYPRRPDANYSPWDHKNTEFKKFKVPGGPSEDEMMLQLSAIKSSMDEDNSDKTDEEIIADLENVHICVEVASRLASVAVDET
ncbi:hypothetical protein BKA93DRAFT_750178 [Sparassis latifolia]